MELRQYFNVLLKWWWLILASVVVAASASLFASLTAPRNYQALTTLMVGQALQNPNPDPTQLYTGQALAQSYTDLARREPVMRSTLKALGLDWDWGILQSMVTSRVVPGTQLLEISVIDTDAQRAMVLANEVANQLILQSPASADSEKEFIRSQIEDLKANIAKGQDEVRQLDSTIAQATSARQIQDARSRQTTLQAQVSSWQATYAQLLSNLQQSSTNSLSIVEPARQPTVPVGAGNMSNALVAAAIGLVLSTSAAFLLEYLDDSIKTSDEAQKTLGIQTLGSIARARANDSGGTLVAVKQPRSPEAETFRVLRTNLQFKAIDKNLRTIMVTSASPGEGKSFTASNLAVAFAQSGVRVILVDADLRIPCQHEIFGLSNDKGFTDALLDPNNNITGLMQPTSVENLRILTTGPLPPNPSELLGSKRSETILNSLLREADLVIYDSPPLLAASDACVLSTRVDGTLLIVDAGRTRRALAHRALEALTSVEAVVLGLVLNHADIRANGYAYYYYSNEGKRRRTSTALGTLKNVARRFRPSSALTQTKTGSASVSRPTKVES